MVRDSPERVEESSDARSSRFELGNICRGEPRVRPSVFQRGEGEHKVRPYATPITRAESAKTPTDLRLTRCLQPQHSIQRTALPALAPVPARFPGSITTRPGKARHVKQPLRMARFFTG